MAIFLKAGTTVDFDGTELPVFGSVAEAMEKTGEIGGDAEERAAAFIADNIRKPVVGYVASFTAPEGKTMGHAGAIVSGSAGTAQAKQEALGAVGVKVDKTPSATARLLRAVIN